MRSSVSGAPKIPPSSLKPRSDMVSCTFRLDAGNAGKNLLPDGMRIAGNLEKQIERTLLGKERKARGTYRPPPRAPGSIAIGGPICGRLKTTGTTREEDPRQVMVRGDPEQGSASRVVLQIQSGVGFQGGPSLRLSSCRSQTLHRGSSPNLTPEAVPSRLGRASNDTLGKRGKGEQPCGQSRAMFKKYLILISGWCFLLSTAPSRSSSIKG